MKRIREFLKRLLPPPVKSFMREVKNILEAINVSKKEIKVQIEKLVKRDRFNSEQTRYAI